MFAIGSLYERNDLLKFIGSKQQQSGILWNKEGSDTVIITSGGRHGKNASYSDAALENGSWEYYGQGSKGDQNPNSAANSLLLNTDKKILLFTTREATSKEARERGHHKKLYRFEGIFKTIAWEIDEQKEGKRKGDKLVKFILRPFDDIIEEINLPVQDPLEDIVLEPQDFYKLRKKVANIKEKPKKEKLFVLTEYQDRSYQIKQYALLRAKGKCENCGHDAPFVNTNNIPFLEVHHIFSLSDEGPDTAINVAAICPNCHKEAHYGKQKENLKNTLSQKIANKERGLDFGTKL
jgi:5-methylcytosine-specific restriction protein A